VSGRRSIVGAEIQLRAFSAGRLSSRKYSSEHFPPVEARTDADSIGFAEIGSAAPSAPSAPSIFRRSIVVAELRALRAFSGLYPGANRSSSPKTVSGVYGPAPVDCRRRNTASKHFPTPHPGAVVIVAEMPHAALGDRDGARFSIDRRRDSIPTNVPPTARRLSRGRK
jgi:hypothetical protein